MGKKGKRKEKLRVSFSPPSHFVPPFSLLFLLLPAHFLSFFSFLPSFRVPSFRVECFRHVSLLFSTSPYSHPPFPYSSFNATHFLTPSFPSHFPTRNPLSHTYPHSLNPFAHSTQHFRGVGESGRKRTKGEK